METYQRIDIWFGTLLLGIGLVALLIAGLLYVVLSRWTRTRQKRWAFLGAPLGIGVIFSLMGSGFAGYGLCQAQIEQRVMATGITTQATVTELQQTYTRLNGRYLWRVHYEYMDQAGRTHGGASGLMDRQDAQSWQPGDQAFVRYDPAQPSVSIWFGREDRAAGQRPQLSLTLTREEATEIQTLARHGLGAERAEA